MLAASGKKRDSAAVSTPARGEMASPFPTSTRIYQKRLSQKRREQLGIRDDEDEYDIGVALSANTDPLISKMVAGSLILAISGLLAVGVLIPSLTDYGEGICNPLLTQGRC
jgi:hypothetical protein